MTGTQRRVKRVRAVLLVFSLSMLLALGCGPTREDRAKELSDPFNNPEFLTPIAQAQEAGTDVYWLGEGFRAGSLVFRPNEANLYEFEGSSPGLHLAYGADISEPDGRVPFDIESYRTGSMGAQEARDLLFTNRGVAAEPVMVGSWSGELITSPGPARPVSMLALFVSVGDTTVVARGTAGGSGVPGEDPNPLIVKDVLIKVVAENLRPYPE